MHVARGADLGLGRPPAGNVASGAAEERAILGLGAGGGAVVAAKGSTRGRRTAQEERRLEALRGLLRARALGRPLELARVAGGAAVGVGVAVLAAHGHPLHRADAVGVGRAAGTGGGVRLAGRAGQAAVGVGDAVLAAHGHELPRAHGVAVGHARLLRLLRDLLLGTLVGVEGLAVELKRSAVLIDELRDHHGHAELGGGGVERGRRDAERVGPRLLPNLEGEGTGTGLGRDLVVGAAHDLGGEWAR